MTISKATGEQLAGIAESLQASSTRPWRRQGGRGTHARRRAGRGRRGADVGGTGGAIRMWRTTRAKSGELTDKLLNSSTRKEENEPGEKLRKAQGKGGGAALKVAAERPGGDEVSPEAGLPISRRPRRPSTRPTPRAEAHTSAGRKRRVAAASPKSLGEFAAKGMEAPPQVRREVPREPRHLREGGRLPWRRPPGCPPCSRTCRSACTRGRAAALWWLTLGQETTTKSSVTYRGVRDGERRGRDRR